MSMKLEISRFLMTVWMPGILTAIVCMFFYDAAPRYWLLALPLLLVLAFMTTLAEIHDRGGTLNVKRWWGSIEVAKQDVVESSPSFLDGISRLKLRRFVLPWGKIYFVPEWSKLRETAQIETSGADSGAKGAKALAALASFALAFSGFVAATAIRSRELDFRMRTSAARIEALVCVAVLGTLFLVTRKKSPSFANVVLFVATFIAGLAYR